MPKTAKKENKITRIPTINMTEKEWLAERRNTIGGSEAAAIVGLDPWNSPYTLWYKKKGCAEETTSLAAEFGRFAEEFVAQRFEAETGKRVRKENAIIRNSDYPYAHANIDRRIVGENAGLECKTTSALNLKQFKNGKYPERYYVQCVHYMMVCGFERMYLACLIGNNQFRIFVIERDEEEISSLAEQEKEFFELLQGDAPPEITAMECDTSTVNELHPTATGGEIGLYGRDDVFTALADLAARKKTIEAEIERLTNVLKADLGDAERGTTENWSCTWSNASKTSYDTRRLFAEHPEIDPEQYAKTTTYRTFKYRPIEPKEDNE